jgi:hypothetical protein
MSRTMAAAPPLVDELVAQLRGNRSGPGGDLDADAMSAGVWSSLWSPYRLRQREFFTFGMDVLLKVIEQ